MGEEDGKRTSRMGVANVGFMVDRLGRDCHPLQYLRELTQNAIEAMEGSGGEVVWDVDWNHYDLTGHYKLSLIDSGIGMTGEDMLKYINQLSSSTHEQSHEGNYGVGAKVAAATRNHAGMVYLSWKDGQGWMTHLWRDPEINEYGARRFPIDDGTFPDYLKINDDLKPEQIGDHGTMVVLLGNDEEEDNTMEPAADSGVEGRQRWITKYLNTRYFRFPDNVAVRVREGYDAPRGDSRRNFLRKVTGMEEFLREETGWYGTVALTDATAHVWIFDERPERTKVGDMFATTGHVAALYGDELYELKTARAGAALLQQFGVIFGYGRVVIYVEPQDGKSGSIGSNTARTQLLRSGEPLPWADWAAEFRDNMPQEISDLMEQIASASTSHDHQQAIRERLKSIRDLFKVSRYRRVRTGPIEVSDDAPGGSPANQNKRKKKKNPGPGGGGGRAGSVYALFADSDGDPGEAVPHPDPIPITKWVSIADGTRESADLEDRAAKFHPDQNLLLINADFRVFTDMVDRWAKQYDNVPGARDVAEEVVHEWFEQALVETVVGGQALSGSAQWPTDDLGKIWSEEGLTAAVLQRYHVDVNVKRTLGAKLGTLKKEAAA